MNHRARFSIGALAGAVALVCSFASFEARALALGRVTVQSALGEPLRAEIDITEISADEAASLRAGVASSDAFRAAGLEYNPAVVGMQVTLLKRVDGRSFLRLSSVRPVTEPFVDLVLEASWASGRVVRDYTMLFDPPALRQSQLAASPVVPTPPMVSRPITPLQPLPPATGLNSIPYSPPVPAPRSIPRRAPAVAAAPAASGNTVAVRPGDTAGKIAAQNKPAEISLDQMLVALLRSNPDAFVRGNINRLRSGAVLDIPSAESAASLSPQEASRAIVAQSKDFNEFRRKLAEGVPAAQTGSPDRQAGGKLEARVEDRAPATTSPDRLTLSKGAVQNRAVAEERIARDRQARDASARVAELSKNIADLNKLSAAPSSAASAARVPGVAVTVPVAPPRTIGASAAAPVSPTVPRTATATAAPMPVASTPAVPAVAVPASAAAVAAATPAASAAASASAVPASAPATG